MASLVLFASGLKMMPSILDPGRKRALSVPLTPTRSDRICTYSCHSDPLIGHGRHFGRTVHALCNVNALITNGLLRLGELADEPEESFTAA